MRTLVAVAILWPALTAAQGRCPWLNTATAGGVLEGAVVVKVAPTNCEFTRKIGDHEAILSIDVNSAKARATHCGPGAEPLKGIGNQAQACTYEGKAGWTAQQVAGTVRDQAFLVRIETNDASLARMARERTVRAAEQVAGILF